MSDTYTDGTERDTRDKILEIIDQVESAVLEEDKLGATREMVVEGTCNRIREEIHALPSEGQDHDCARDPGEIGGPSCASPVPDDRSHDTGTEK